MGVEAQRMSKAEQEAKRPREARHRREARRDMKILQIPGNQAVDAIYIGGYRKIPQNREGVHHF